MLIIQEINIIKHNINMLDIEDFKKKLDKKSRIMGIDPGGKRIGIAISDENKIVATPYTTIIKNNYPDFIKEIKKIIDEHQIKGIIIGNPINMDGSLGRSAQSVNDVSNNIDQAIDIDVCLWDERLSTVGAFNLSSQLDVNVTKREKNIDQNAAAFILQGAIDFLNN